MLYFPLHRFFSYNGEIKPNSDFKVSENAGGVYEVLRVVNSIPLFLEDHLERFFISASIAGKTIRFGKKDITGFIFELIKMNGAPVGNILLSCKTNLKAFFIPHKYPEEKWYETGVLCGILKAERNNPNAKVFQTSVRQKADEMMEKQGLYEVLLVHHQNRITEGSRSNVFFVCNNQLLTPPGHEVLIGITRQKTILLAKNEGISFYEKEIQMEDLPHFQAAFITGTSPKILPVSQIDDWKFDAQNSLVQQLRLGYSAMIKKYIEGKKSEPDFNKD